MGFLINNKSLCRHLWGSGPKEKVQLQSSSWLSLSVQLCSDFVLRASLKLMVSEELALVICLKPPCVGLLSHSL